MIRSQLADTNPPSFRDPHYQMCTNTVNGKPSNDPEVLRYQSKLANFLQDELCADYKPAPAPKQPEPINLDAEIKRITPYLLTQVKALIKPEADLLRAIQVVFILFHGIESWVPATKGPVDWKQVQKYLNQRFIDLLANYKAYTDRITPEKLNLAKHAFISTPKKTSPRNGAQLVIVKVAQRLLDHYDAKLRGLEEEQELCGNFFMNTRHTDTISPINPIMDVSDHLDMTWPFPQGSSTNLKKQKDPENEEVQQTPPLPYELVKPVTDQQQHQLHPVNHTQHHQTETPQTQHQQSLSSHIHTHQTESPGSFKERLNIRQGSKLQKFRNLKIEFDSSKPQTTKNTPSQGRNSKPNGAPLSKSTKGTSMLYQQLRSSNNQQKTFGYHTPESKTTKSNVTHQIPQKKENSIKPQSTSSTHSKKISFTQEPQHIDQAIQQHRQLIEKLQKQESEVKQKIEQQSKTISTLESNDQGSSNPGIKQNSKRSSIPHIKHHSPKTTSWKPISPSLRAKQFLFK